MLIVATWLDVLVDYRRKDDKAKRKKILCGEERVFTWKTSQLSK